MREILRKWTYMWTEPPFTPLLAAPLLVLGSARLAYALISILALGWTFFLSALFWHAPRRLLPRRGRNFIIVLLASFAASLFYLFLFLINPVLASECALLIAFTPAIFCAGGFWDTETPAPEPELAALLAPLGRLFAGIAALLFAVALVREPFGYASLSLPGGSGGVIELFTLEGMAAFPARIASSAAGALLLLGYTLALFRHINRDRDSGINPRLKTEAPQ